MTTNVIASSPAGFTFIDNSDLGIKTIMKFPALFHSKRLLFFAVTFFFFFILKAVVICVDGNTTSYLFLTGGTFYWYIEYTSKSFFYCFRLSNFFLYFFSHSMDVYYVYIPYPLFAIVVYEFFFPVVIMT